MGLFAAAVLLPLSLLHVVVVVAPAKSAARYASCCGVVIVVVLLVCLTNLHKQRCTHTHTYTERETRTHTGAEQVLFEGFLAGLLRRDVVVVVFVFILL